MLRDHPGRSTREQVRQAIERQIREGGYAPGTHLEPIRVLAEKHGVSYVTMRRALTDLQDCGLVRMQRGAGVFVGDATGAAGEDRVDALRVAVVLPMWMERHSFDYVPRILRGLLPCLDARGWRAELVDCGDRGSDPGFLGNVLGRRPNAVVWLSPIFTHQMNLVRVADRGVPVVTTGRRFPNVPFRTVSVDIPELAGRFLAWATTKGVERLDFVGFTSDGITADPVAVEYGDAFEAAGRTAGVPVVRHTLPRSANADMLRACLRPAPGRRVFAIMAEQFLEPLAALALDGFWENPADLTVLDVIGRGVPQLPRAFGGMRYVCAQAPLERVGRAVARELELALLGETELPAPDLRAALLEGQPPRPAELRPLAEPGARD